MGLSIRRLNTLATGVASSVMNSLSRFWNGDYRLVHSFWLWGLLVSQPFGILTVALAFFIGSSMGFGAGVFVYLALMIPFISFIYVGLWRSATKYQGRVWGVLVKFIIVAGVLNFIYAATQISQQLSQILTRL